MIFLQELGKLFWFGIQAVIIGTVCLDDQILKAIPPLTSI